MDCPSSSPADHAIETDPNAISEAALAAAYSRMQLTADQNLLAAHSVTCRYASRAMAIKNSLKLNNQMTAEEEVVYLKQVVAELQEENERLRRLMAVSNTQRVSGTVSAGVGGRVPAGPGRISVGA